METVKRLLSSVWELLFLQMTGLGTGYSFINGPTWYLSAMLVCGYFIYYLAAKWREFFISFIAPFSVLTIYGFFSQTTGHIDNWGTKLSIFLLTTAQLRAWAGICLGMLCYLVYLQLGKLKPEKYMVWMLSVFETIALIAILATVYRGGHTKKDFMIILALCGLLLLVAWNITGLDKLLDHRMSGYLGKLSLSIYLTHVFAFKLAFKFFSPHSFIGRTCWLLFSVIIFAAVSDWMVNILLKGMLKWKSKRIDNK